MDTYQYNYVVGFLFKEDKSSVVLIRKDRPAWQAGKLNGVGGKIEPNESAIDAMVREFREETSVDTNPSIWTHFCWIHGDNYSIKAFKAFDDKAWELAKTETSEEVVKFDPRDVVYLKYAPNLSWLIFAASSNDAPNYMDVTFDRPDQAHKQE